MAKHSIPDVAESRKKLINLILNASQAGIVQFVKLATFSSEFSFFVVQQPDPIDERAMTRVQSQKEQSDSCDHYSWSQDGLNRLNCIDNDVQS